MSITKFNRSAFAAASLLALVAAPAFAADVVENIPEPAAPMEEAPVISTWGGAYLGAYGNYSFSGHGDVAATANSVDLNGFGGGAFAGYNYDFGGVVAGVEGDLGYHDIHGANAGVAVDGGVGGSLRARLGYAVSPGIMPYVTAGGAAQRVEVTNAAAVSETNTHLGWTAGAGLDVKVTDNVFLRGEYRYTDLGSKTYSNVASDVDVQDNRVTFGVGMKF